MIEIITLAVASIAVILGIISLVRKPDTAQMERRIAEELRAARQEIGTSVGEAVRSAASLQADAQRQNAEHQDARLRELNESFKRSAVESELKLENIRTSVQGQLAAMQTGNEKKLDQMRQIVDEKLQKTLNDRLTQSFSQVSSQLEQVYKGLGEMQTIAAGVGDLKKVLSNVKTRGILGEIQLGSILEEILTPEQYEANVAVKRGSKERVEFAVKLPGDGEQKNVWLPIDAKFPADAYSNLLDAQAAADPAAAEEAGKVLEARVKSFAKDIRDKYINVPFTTEFAIMFLPFEGLYSEVVRRGFVEKLQREYKVNIAGPTTMAALLNSLQMGFKTLAIQKSSSEVWKVLGQVKTEFEKFEGLLDKVHDNLDRASRNIDDLRGVRTRQIIKQLSKVESIPEAAVPAGEPTGFLEDLPSAQ